MTLGVRYYTPNAFEVAIDGVPIVGGQLFFYITQTSTALDTWSDVGLTTPNTNPVVADASGHFGSIFLTPAQAYKVSCYAANSDPLIPSTPASPQGQLLWEFDPVGPAASGATQNVAGILGEVRDFAGPAAAVPVQWLLCHGQAIDRTAFAALFAVIGTSWGAGNGTTTFNVPDLRGRLTAGLDNMGGTPANRITAGVCGVAGATLGASGGNQHAQQDTLTGATTVSITDPTHAHVLAGSVWNATTGTPSGTDGLTSGGITIYNNPVTAAASTGISATASTTVTSSLTGASQNVQPTAMLNKIIYAGA